jgi:hypothetical protein
MQSIARGKVLQHKGYTCQRLGGPLPRTIKNLVDKNGDKNHFFGKHHTEESKQQSRSKMSKEWIITFPDGTETMIKGLEQFCREHSLDSGAMGKVSKGKAKHHKGYRCRKVTPSPSPSLHPTVQPSEPVLYTHVQGA